MPKKMVTRPKVQEYCIYKVRKEKIQKVLTTSLKKKNTPPITKMSYVNSPPKYMTTLILKLLPLFVMNDRGGESV